MQHILQSASSTLHGHGPFRVRRMRPGTILGPDADPAFGPFSVLDHANLDIGALVKMHEHKNDEILSYLWRGTMLHEDTSGHRIAISPRKLMMMNAGGSFRHEESTPDEPVEMLQIFVRPTEANLPGKVQFYDRPEVAEDGRWHLIGGPDDSGAPLGIRQRVSVYDVRLAAEQDVEVPTAGRLVPWVYVMDGAVSVGGAALGKGDAVTDLEQALPCIRAKAATTLVAFLVDRNAQASQAGTISGC